MSTKDAAEVGNDTVGGVATFHIDLALERLLHGSRAPKLVSADPNPTFANRPSRILVSSR